MKLLTALVAVCTLAAVVIARSGSPNPSKPIEGIVDLTPDNFDSVVGSDAFVVVEFYAGWCGYCKKLVPELTKVGKALAERDTDKVIVAKIDGDEYSKYADRFGVKGFPTLKYFKPNSRTAHAYDGERDAASIIQFLEDESGVSITGKPDSDPSSSSYVVDLDHKTFDKTVLDTSKDVMVLFYAPWCPYCQEIAPEFEQVAVTFAKDNDIVLARLNLDIDEHKPFLHKYEVDGFPTVKFFPKHDKNGQNFDDERTATDLVTFVNNNRNRVPKKHGKHKGRVVPKRQVRRTTDEDED